MYDSFLHELGRYYQEHGRHGLPWRCPEADGTFDGYKILVSEVMLQQTQVSRVLPKYSGFLVSFPTFQALANAPLGEVLVAWQGLGYNRRAKFLWQAAQKVAADFAGTLPRDQLTLETLPGIGRNTAGAILAYTYDEPAVFIETNIRTVYIHHFFHDRVGISDHEIVHVVEASLGEWLGAGTGCGAREFYWALMDYGTHLKQTVGNSSRASRAYAKQSKFQGSLRQLRGRVLRTLAEGSRSETELLLVLQDERTADVLGKLLHEGMVRKVGQSYRLP